MLCNAIQNLEATFTCLTISPNIIQIQKAFIYQEVGSGQQIAFRVRNLRNPVKSQVNASDEIVIRTLTPKGYLIDSSENIGFKIGCVQPCNTC